jgi:hypothetical protein
MTYICVSYNVHMSLSYIMDHQELTCKSQFDFNRVSCSGLGEGVWKLVTRIYFIQ